MELAFQDTNFEYMEIERIKSALSELGYKPNTFGLIPFSDTVHITKEFTKPTLMLGGTKLIKLAMKGLLPENGMVFYDSDKFDQANYSNVLNSELYNYGAEFILWGDIKNTPISKPMFIKPSSDLKLFAGLVLYPSKNTVEDELRTSRIIDNDLCDTTMILVNYNVDYDVYREFRAFIVSGKIVDISQYMKCGRLNQDVVDKQSDLFQLLSNYISEIQQIYEPHNHYVIDVSENAGMFKVMEFNCLNCSGFYANSRVKVYRELLQL